MFTTLMPSNKTDFEVSLEEATDIADVVGPSIDDIHGLKYARPLNITVAPWLVYEYGLGPISNFFDTIEDLIDEGRVWQKIRGTPLAITTSLSWIDYDTITIEDQVTGRRRWHLYQIEMGELPGADEIARLTNAEYLAGLSDPARSFFWRGYFGYDVRGHVWGRSTWGRSIWGDSSGVRIADGKVKWSHGRTHTINATAEAGKAATLGVEFTDGEDVTWLESLTWGAPGLTWDGVSDARLLKSWLMLQKSAHIGLFDALGDAIGYARVVRAVNDLTDYEDLNDTVVLAYDATVGFGIASGDVASVAVVFGGVADGVAPFKTWLDPDQIDFPGGEVRVGGSALSFTFLETVRERIVINLTI